MAFPLIPALIALITNTPAIIKAVKTVKELKDDVRKIDIPADVKRHALTKDQLNAYKRSTAIAILKRYFGEKLKNRGCKPADIGVIVDFACVMKRLIRGKKS